MLMIDDAHIASPDSGLENQYHELVAGKHSMEQPGRRPRWRRRRSSSRSGVCFVPGEPTSLNHDGYLNDSYRIRSGAKPPKDQRKGNNTGWGRRIHDNLNQSLLKFAATDSLCCSCPSAKGSGFGDRSGVDPSTGL